MPLSLLRFWSPAVLMNRSFLWLLFAVNLLGTIYGYIWYGSQLVYTYNHHPHWQLPFVPDSPTASLFFTIALLFLLYPSSAQSRLSNKFRVVIEALAVVTSIKYGVWAVAVIFAAAAQGDALVWQDWMLVVSHLGMAIEALLYVRFMVFGRAALLIATAWMLLNDTIDYQFGVFPSLPSVLRDDLPVVERFTYGLSLVSMLVVSIALIHRQYYRRRL